jgi:hypothetical protein
MADTEKKSTSSREGYKGDAERANNSSVDLNKNVTARSVCPRCRRGCVVATYSPLV